MKFLSQILLMALLPSLPASAQTSTSLTVGGTNNLYGAGLSVPPGDGSLPAFTKFDAGPGKTIFFRSVTGTVTSGASFGPDGEGSSVFGTAMDACGGLSGIWAERAFFLAGVFLSDSPPNPQTPPAALDFRATALGRDFESLSPLIGQTFYIGDGRVGEGGLGALQTFNVPATATRLFLGVIDGQFDGSQVFGSPGNYYDNGGAFRVEVMLEGDACAAQLSIHVSQVDLCWGTCSNKLYQVQYRSLETTNNWVNLGSPIPGNGMTNCISDPVDPSVPARCYQVVTSP